MVASLGADVLVGKDLEDVSGRFLKTNARVMHSLQAFPHVLHTAGWGFEMFEAFFVGPVRSRMVLPDLSTFRCQT